MDSKLHVRRIVIIAGIGVLLISAELLAFRSLNRSVDALAHDIGTPLQKVTSANPACSTYMFVPKEPAIVASFNDLSTNPELFDGRLVRVRALLEFGWEGDNFLVDPSKVGAPLASSHRAPPVWFHSRPECETDVWHWLNFGGPPVLGTFTGYFHFVPDRKSRTNDTFDPGPFQLEAIAVSVVDHSNSEN